MAHTPASSQQHTETSKCDRLNGMQDDDDDDDAVWMEYINRSSIEDARLIDGWTKIMDVTLVYVALLGGALTAFITQTASRFRPDPQEVTNQLLLAIYNHNTNPNPSTPINVEKFFKLDDNKLKQAVFLNSILYTSLAISVTVAVVAMAAKLWIVRYKHEVSVPGPPRLRATRRQEVYDGTITWRLDKCIEAIAVYTLIAVVFFAIFIFSSISEEQKQLGPVVGAIFNVGLCFVLVTSFTAAFISTSPFRSPFSDVVNFVFRGIFRIFCVPKAELEKKIGIIPQRTIVIVLTSVAVLAPTGFLIFEYAVGAPLIYFPLAAMFALAREKVIEDIQPRLYNLPEWATFTTCAIFITTDLTLYLSNNRILFYILFFLTVILLGIQGFGVIRLSPINARTADVNVILWLLSAQGPSSHSPDLFEKAVQIAGKSHNLRARLLKSLLPLLVPLIKKDDEQHRYLNCLAKLVDYKPCEASFWLNQASTEHPSLPPRLKKTLEKIHRCQHMKQNAEKKWMDGTERCPEECSGDAAEHILRMLGKDKGTQKEPKIEDA